MFFVSMCSVLNLWIENLIRKPLALWVIVRDSALYALVSVSDAFP